MFNHVYDTSNVVSKSDNLTQFREAFHHLGNIRQALFNSYDKLISLRSIDRNNQSITLLLIWYADFIDRSMWELEHLKAALKNNYNELRSKLNKPIKPGKLYDVEYKHLQILEPDQFNKLVNLINSNENSDDEINRIVNTLSENLYGSAFSIGNENEKKGLMNKLNELCFFLEKEPDKFSVIRKNTNQHVPLLENSEDRQPGSYRGDERNTGFLDSIITTALSETKAKNVRMISKARLGSQSPSDYMKNDRHSPVAIIVDDIACKLYLFSSKDDALKQGFVNIPPRGPNEHSYALIKKDDDNAILILKTPSGDWQSEEIPMSRIPGSIRYRNWEGGNCFVPLRSTAINTAETNFIINHDGYIDKNYHYNRNVTLFQKNSGLYSQKPYHSLPRQFKKYWEEYTQTGKSDIVLPNSSRVEKFIKQQGGAILYKNSSPREYIIMDFIKLYQLRLELAAAITYLDERILNIGRDAIKFDQYEMYIDALIEMIEGIAASNRQHHDFLSENISELKNQINALADALRDLKSILNSTEQEHHDLMGNPCFKLLLQNRQDMLSSLALSAENIKRRLDVYASKNRKSRKVIDHPLKEIKAILNQDKLNHNFSVKSQSPSSQKSASYGKSIPSPSPSDLSAEKSNNILIEPTCQDNVDSDRSADDLYTYSRCISACYQASKDLVLQRQHNFTYLHLLFQILLYPISLLLNKMQLCASSTFFNKRSNGEYFLLGQTPVQPSVVIS